MNDRPTFTLAEAADRSDQSISTLRRWLKADKIDGAHRVDPNDSSSAWRIPIDGLLAAGATLDAPDNPDPAPTEQPLQPLTTEVGRLAELERENADLLRRAEVAEAIADERAAALDDARLALRALTMGDQPKADEAEEVIDLTDKPAMETTFPAAPVTRADKSANVLGKVKRRSSLWGKKGR